MVEGATNKRPLEEGTSDEAKVITFGIRGQDDNVIFFKVKTDTVMKVILKKYCEKKNVVYKTVRFLYKGKFVAARDTVKNMRLKDGSEIDAMLFQTGGGKHAQML